jgi:cation transport regulator ChaC
VRAPTLQKDFPLETRITNRQVTFARPFRLVGLEALHRPGTFILTLKEEQLDARSSARWRQIAAILQLKSGRATEYLAIDMQDLREALLHDTQQSTDPPFAPATAAAQNPHVLEMLQARQS